jgi:tRNA threonylcarbamoyladenosine biosynthesis protein TsaE
MKFSCHVTTSEAMQNLGAELAKICNSNCIIFFSGDLGVGKTTLVRGFLRAFGVKTPVKSPSFTLLEPYFIDHKKIYHFDFYRLFDPEELEFIGARDYFNCNSICLVEWPERGHDMLPRPDLICRIIFTVDGRMVEFVSVSSKGVKILEQLKAMHVT